MVPGATPKEFLLSVGSITESLKAYVVMEFVPSVTLEKLHEPRNYAAIRPHANRFAAQILAALEIIHDVDLIQIDLKDGNILVESNGLIKNFGGVGGRARQAFRIRGLRARAKHPYPGMGR